MGKEIDAADMEIDASDQIANPRYSINVLQLLKSAQMQHGLRHGDYARYRRYCTARLRRLYKSLKFTHGRGKYTRRAINESTVTEVRYLHMVLYTAERAWSHAMEKRQLPDGPTARQRIYLIGRLRKAVKWADLFSQLCAVKGDSRTSLEAEVRSVLQLFSSETVVSVLSHALYSYEENLVRNPAPLRVNWGFNDCPRYCLGLQLLVFNPFKNVKSLAELVHNFVSDSLDEGRGSPRVYKSRWLVRCFLCTFYSSLEHLVPAYAAYINGTLLFEQDRNWKTALKSFVSARAVYEELGKYGDLENQVLCRERVEELEPSIRYCRHKIGESNLPTSELLQIGEMQGPALDLFKAKLKAAMAEARSQQAASLTEFHWLGHRFPISNAKIRVAILKAQELEKDLQGASADALLAEKRLGIYDKVFAAYHEARSCIRSELVSAGNADGVKEDLNGLDKAVSAVLGQRTIERNQLLVSIAKSKLMKRRDDKNEKVTRPEELVRLYDLLLQNTADLSDLVSSGRDRKPEEVAFGEIYESTSLAFRAERCFYLARSYSVAGKRAEAYALYCHARSLADDAIQKFQTLGNQDEMIKQMQNLDNDCRSNCCIEHATGILEDEKASGKLSKKISSISLTGGDKKVEKFLLENLDAYESAVGDPSLKGHPRIVAFPPAFKTIARDPIVLDLVYNYIDFQSLENRMKKDKKGFISRLWR